MHLVLLVKQALTESQFQIVIINVLAPQVTFRMQHKFVKPVIILVIHVKVAMLLVSVLLAQLEPKFLTQ